MLSKKLGFLLVFWLGAHTAWACSDYFCEPTWALNLRGYHGCSNLPTLSPSNDTRVNLKLLLIATGRARLKARPVGKDDEALGYGAVPFTQEAFAGSILSADGAGAADVLSGYGSGTRCASNDTGKADFMAAVDASTGLSTDERRLLKEARQKLTPGCADAPTDPQAGSSAVDRDEDESESPVFNQFMQYLDAADAFYDGRYGEAEFAFAVLATGGQPWLKESALYMLGRTELNLAQQDAFDSYGFPDLAKTDQKALQKAEVKFAAYLQAYPEGRYAASARGLLRRVYWMSNRQEKLADEYGWQLDNPGAPQHNGSLNELAQEADDKLLATADLKQIKHPLLLATLDLALMRSSDPADKKRIGFSDLQRQEPLFSAHKALFGYLLAAHCFYVQKDAPAALHYLPEAIPVTLTYLDLSRMVLRGLALEAAKDYAGARKLWLALLPLAKQPLQAETLQLALALNYEQSGTVEAVFAANSPITDPTIRTILIRNDASAHLLRRIIAAKSTPAQERHSALYTLLYKDLLQGQYRDYLKDYPLLPADAATDKAASGGYYDRKPYLALFTWSGQRTGDSYACPSTLDIARRLAQNPKDPQGLVCLGDFVNANDLPSGPAVSYGRPQPPADHGAVLGTAPSRFPGRLFSRGDGYRTVIAAAGAAPDLKAYALFRAMQCYATSGYNHCGGTEVEKPVRQSWFRLLKTRYAATDWAKALKYYW